MTDEQDAWLAERRAAKKAEQVDAQRVMRHFAKHLLAKDFSRKSTFFARTAGPIIQFVHVHKYSFGGAFRIHVCVRVANSPRPSIALLGMENKDDEPSQKFEYRTGDSDSIAACAELMATFVEDIAEPWFRMCSPSFLQSTRSFLPEEDRHHLKNDLRGQATPAAVTHSLLLFGLTQPVLV